MRNVKTRRINIHERTINAIYTDLINAIDILRGIQEISWLLKMMVVIQKLVHIELGIKVYRAIITCFNDRVYTLRYALEVLRLQSLDV